MKYIFDFDDVLFDSRKFKERMFVCMERVGIAKHIADKRYQEIRTTEVPFSLKTFLAGLSAEAAYDDIMHDCKSFLNQELLHLIIRLGKENCILLTEGDEEFQNDKIYRTAVDMFFSEIKIVPGTKEFDLERISDKYRDEQIVYIDNKEDSNNRINQEEHRNLRFVKYNEDGLEKVKAEIQRANNSEIKRR